MFVKLVSYAGRTSDLLETASETKGANKRRKKLDFVIGRDIRGSSSLERNSTYSNSRF